MAYVDGFVIPMPKNLAAYRRQARLGARIWKEYGALERVNTQVMKDPRMNSPEMLKSVPFDMKRMVYGGFKVLVSW